MAGRQKSAKPGKTPANDVRPASIPARSWLLLIAFGLFALTRIYILFALTPMLSDLHEPYFFYAFADVDAHQVPYAGEFEIEYPPLAWWMIRAPRVLSGQPIQNIHNRAQIETAFIPYRWIFRGLMFTGDLTSLLILLLITSKLRPQWTGWAALTYTLSTAVLGHMMYDRLDVGLLLLLMLWAYCWLQSLEVSNRAEAWSAASYLLMGLSISYKIIPVICVPFLLLADLRGSRRLSPLLIGLAALACGVCLPFAIQYLESGPGVFSFFKFHAQREVQIESLYSTLMMLGAVFGVPIAAVHGQGAYNLSGDWAHAMKILSILAMLAFLGGLGGWALWKGRGFSRRDAFCAACYAIAGAVAISNVLSTQYFIWAMPLIILLSMVLLPSGPWSRWLLFILLMVVVAATTWISPYHYYRAVDTPNGLVPLEPELWGPAPIAAVILGLRNFAYLGTVIWLGILLVQSSRDQSNSTEPN